MTEGEYVLTGSDHEEHHKFLHTVAEELHEFIAERRAARARWQKVKDTAVGTMVVTIIGAVVGFLAWIGHLVLNALGITLH